jgi:hypothetical protein
MRAPIAGLFMLFAGSAVAQPSGCPFVTSKCGVIATGSGASLSTLADMAADVVNSRRYPLHSDTAYYDTTTNTSVSGTNAFTITGGPAFTSAYVGRTITIGKSGGGGSPVSTTISTVVDSTHITTAANAGTSGANSSYVVVGTPDDTLFRTMVSNLPASGGTIEVFPGNYMVSAAINLPSNTRVKCHPGATFYMQNGWNALSTHYIFVNANHVSSSLIDHDIEVDGCTFYGSTPTPSTGADGIRWSYATNVSVKNSTFHGFGDAVAHVGTVNSLVYNSVADGVTNTCWDHWDGPTQGRVVLNSCVTAKHGIQITGTDSPQTASKIATGFELIGNLIEVQGVAGAGIWLNSGALVSNGSGTADVRIIGGRIIGTNLTAGQLALGFKASGGGTTNIRMMGTEFHTANVAVNPVDVDNTASNTPSDVHFTGISISDASVAGGQMVQLKAPNTSLVDSSISGGGYQYAVEIAASSVMVMNNRIVAGTGARIHETSGSNHILIDTSDVTGIIAVTGTLYAKAPTSCSGALTGTLWNNAGTAAFCP